MLLHLQVCKVLVAAKADVNCAALSTATPLWFASQEGHFEVVKYLFSVGAIDDRVKVIGSP